MSRFDIKTRTGLISQMLLNTQSVQIVLSGLIVYLDAAIPSSYSGSGTAWNDLSTAGNNATLINGPTFSSSNGGTIVFDGTNDYAQLPIINLAASGSVSLWFYKTGAGTPSGNVVDLVANVTGDGFYGWSCGLNTSTNKLDFYIANSGAYGVENFSTASISNSTWYNVVFTYNGTNKVMYINGTQDSTFASAVTGTNTTTQWGIASRVQSPLRVFQGNIPVVMLYNRALTSAEVLQNFNALKVRYGL